MQIHRITARQALNHVGGDPYDYDLNIYRGCANRCRYCFAIYSQEFLKPQAGETNFFEDIFIKENIVELLERRPGAPPPAVFSGCGFSGCGCAPPNFSLPPAPNTPFIKLSQSSVYAMVLPSIGVFSSSIVNCAAFCKHKKAPPFGGADSASMRGSCCFLSPCSPALPSRRNRWHRRSW